MAKKDEKEEVKAEETKEPEKKSAAKAKKLEGVAVGRVVHFVSPGNVNSLALITRVHDQDIGVVNLFVIRDDTVRDYHFESSIAHSDDKETGTWHFPEKEW